MAAVSDTIPHIVRTAQVPRQEGLHHVQVSKIDQVNSSVRLIQLQLPSTDTTFTHLPGQWLDVHIPSIPQVGGFTITSAPHHAKDSRIIELAIQRSSYHSPAAFFWQPPTNILGTPLRIRVGGRFVYPPPDLSEAEAQQIKRVVFIAGGVGINPIMSMLEHIRSEGHADHTRIPSLRVLYGTRTKAGEAILFYDRIGSILGDSTTKQSNAEAECQHKATMYFTSGTHWSPDQMQSFDTSHIDHEHRRINPRDLLNALGPVHDRKNTVAYICGPPAMTDEFVEILSGAEGMDSSRVLCEKWW